MSSSADIQISDVQISVEHACCICETTFSTASNMKRHLKKVHKEDISKLSVKRKMQCPLCVDFSCRRYAELNDHLEMNHGISIEIEHKVFANMNEFETWKSSVETQTHSSYSKLKGTATLQDGSQKVMYECHRSGRYRAKGLGTRTPSGTKKINSTCPAKISVTFDVDKPVNVEFVKTHCGHPADSASDETCQLEIDPKLQMGATMAKLINDANGAIMARHLESLNMSEYVISQGLNDQKWEIYSSICEDATSYVVKVANEDCNCCLRCEICSKCIHNFQCSCRDSSIMQNMCKHVHFVCKSVDERANLDEQNASQNIDLLEVVINENGIDKENKVEVNVVDLPNVEFNAKQKNKDDLLRKSSELYRELVNLCDSVELTQELQNILKSGKSRLQMLKEIARKKNKTNRIHVKKIQIPSSELISPQRLKLIKTEPIDNNYALQKPSLAEEKQILYTLVLS